MTAALFASEGTQALTEVVTSAEMPHHITVVGAATRMLKGKRGHTTSQLPRGCPQLRREAKLLHPAHGKAP